jgi:hypothetical protein
MLSDYLNQKEVTPDPEGDLIGSSPDSQKDVKPQQAQSEPGEQTDDQGTPKESNQQATESSDPGSGSQGTNQFESQTQQRFDEGLRKLKTNNRDRIIHVTRPSSVDLKKLSRLFDSDIKIHWTVVTGSTECTKTLWLPLSLTSTLWFSSSR